MLQTVKYEVPIVILAAFQIIISIQPSGGGDFIRLIHNAPRIWINSHYQVVNMRNMKNTNIKEARAKYTQLRAKVRLSYTDK